MFQLYFYKALSILQVCIVYKQFTNTDTMWQIQNFKHTCKSNLLDLLEYISLKGIETMVIESNHREIFVNPIFKACAKNPFV